MQITSIGFKEALLATMTARYVLSPSTATIFTSELPSNFTTPVGTPGTNTPIPGYPGHPMHHPGGHGVNPLLVAATRNVMQPNTAQQHLQVPVHTTPLPKDPNVQHHHRGHSQAPTSIKIATSREHFPEWKDPKHSGMEEADFLGLQMAGRIVYVAPPPGEKNFMTRAEFNDQGPSTIHEYAL